MWPKHTTHDSVIVREAGLETDRAILSYLSITIKLPGQMML